MKNSNEYSDEYINAYVDGELDHEDRARLLSDEQDNPELARRIYGTRMLKEKVRLAYSVTPESTYANQQCKCTDFAKHRNLLVASIIIIITSLSLLLPAIVENDDIVLARQLINNTQAVAPDSISKAIGQHKRVLINLSQYQPQNFDATIDSIEALLLQRITDKAFSVEIIASKNGLKALDTNTSIHFDRIDQITKQFDNLEVIACAKSLATLIAEGDPVQLSKAIAFTPSAAQQVARRTKAGWLYLRM